MKAMILDDEKEAAEALRLKLGLVDSSVEILHIFNDPLEAVPVINATQFDVLFIDIDMPGLNGFEVLSALKNKSFKVVFVTAYSEYSIKAIKAHAFDYLLKPIDSTELKETMKKLREEMEMPLSPPAGKVDELRTLLKKIDKNEQKLMLNSQNEIIFVGLEEVVHIEAKGNYCIFHMHNDTTHLVTKTIGEYEEQLQENNFFRVHKTYLVNMKHIKRFDKMDMIIEMSNQTRIEVASRRKNEFMDLLQKTYGS